MNRFIGLGFWFSEVASVLDEEVDEGGGKASLKDERATAFWGLKIRGDFGYSGYPVFGPWKRHGWWSAASLSLPFEEKENGKLGWEGPKNG